MMKTKVAMAISLAGVLAAGTAAALVNTQVLNGGSSGSQLAALDAPQTTPATADVAGETIPSDTTIVEPQVDSSSQTQAMYAIGEAGTVTLDTANGMLSIVAAAPAPGWVITESETDGRANAEVKFQSGDVEIEFHANLLYGVVNTSVESNDVSTDDGVVSGEDDDDDDDHGEDDDHGGDDD